MLREDVFHLIPGHDHQLGPETVVFQPLNSTFQMAPGTRRGSETFSHSSCSGFWVSESRAAVVTALARPVEVHGDSDASDSAACLLQSLPRRSLCVHPHLPLVSCDEW